MMIFATVNNSNISAAATTEVKHFWAEQGVLLV